MRAGDLEAARDAARVAQDVSEVFDTPSREYHACAGRGDGMGEFDAQAGRRPGDDGCITLKPEQAVESHLHGPKLCFIESQVNSLAG